MSALTVEQVAEEMGVSSRTIMRDIKDGHLAVLKVRHNVRVEPEALHRYKEYCRSLSDEPVRQKRKIRDHKPYTRKHIDPMVRMTDPFIGHEA